MSGRNGIAASDAQGIYYTNDGGLNWTLSGQTKGTYTVAIDGSNAVAGNMIETMISDGSGVLISSNAGVSWQQSSLTSGYSENVSIIGNYALANSNENVFFSNNYGNNFNRTYLVGNFATSGANGLLSGNSYISTSNNYGESWTNSVNSPYAFGLAIDGSNALFLSDDSKLYYSTNAGITFAPSDVDMSIQLPLAISEKYAIVGSGNSQGLLYSKNYGANFYKSNLQTGYFSSFSIDSSNAIVSSESTGLYYSTNGGKTFTASTVHYGSLPYFHSYNQVVISKPYSMATGYGLWFSSDVGQNWYPSNINSTPVSSVSNSDDCAVAASSNGRGIYRSIDSGKTWSPTNITSGSFKSICIHKKIASVLSSDGSELYSSNDSGETWSITPSKFFDCFLHSTGNTWTKANISNKIFDLVNISETVECLASGNNLYYNKKYGENYGSLTESTIDLGNINSVSISGTNGIAIVTKDLFYTINSGNDWSQCVIPKEINPSYLSVSMDGTNGIAGTDADGLQFSILYGVNTGTNVGSIWYNSNINSGSFPTVSISGNYAIAGSGDNKGLFHSNDCGQTWKHSNVTTVIVQSVSISGKYAIAGTSNGLYYSIDYGNIWERTMF